MTQKLSDPRGIERIVEHVETPLDRFEATGNGDGPVRLTLDCGHVVERVNHFSYRVGESARCRKCSSSSAGVPIRES